ncbi:FecR domain-containing protein [Stenotrophomonas sp. 24(2023)]|uniref:FecR family protein n=1 Tax=Stenotrophomonas sp. 24(2023) TaxID=3068324 RepID=UPI0027E01A2D|nr:FecR domain-containing protein [Stenotrophomonas sp. 24(2023)]WMJ68329.1 FecR domain-containing protein [Stenotrophomonas sp. 24(2023)]
MSRHTPAQADALFQRASEWVARLEAPDCSADEREAFEDWLAAHPTHVQAWAQAERLYQHSAALAGDSGLRSRAARTTRAPSPTYRRWPQLAVAAGICLAVGLGWMLVNDGFPTPQVQANHSLHAQRQVLPDGTVAVLDAGTSLTMRIGWRTRRITLDSGRVQLQVAPSSRPLRVQAGSSTIRDIGTTFQVERLSAGHVDVALLEGAVEVSSGRAQQMLLPGQQLQVLPSGSMLRGPPVSSAASTGWLQGALVFDATPLSVVVERMNRYTRTPLVVTDPSVAALAVSGTFRAGDAEDLLSVLELGWSISAQRRADGALELHRTR